MTDVEKGYPAASPRHPAQMLFILSLLCVLLAVLLGFIAVFVPWVMKDIGVGTRAWAYPFKTCFEDTFSPVNYEWCQDNDFIAGSKGGTPLTGGNSTCQAFILTTIAFVFISVIGGVLLLLLGAWIFLSLWNRPLKRAIVYEIGVVLGCIAACLAWIFFICYAEKTCAAGSIFPVKGYSYGFILYIFASALWIGAVVTGFMAVAKIKAFLPDQQQAPIAYPGAPADDAAYPSYPVYDPAGAMAAPTPLLPLPAGQGSQPLYY